MNSTSLKISIIIALLTISNLVVAQTDTVKADTPKLPFAIAKEKRMDQEELDAKKEGISFTGIPDISSDPINGQGVGAEGSIFFNGTKSDPFFAYTPYRAQLNVAVFLTNRAQKELSLGLDIPYIANTKWRLRTEAAYSVSPNKLFFGITEKTLNPLSYYPGNNPSNGLVKNTSYSSYEKSLTGSRTFYNTYQQTEAVLNISGERSFLDGKMRLLIGYEIASINISTPHNDSSFLHQQYLDGNITGFGSNRISLLQTGIIYDTRNLETDPSRGVFAEVTNELSSKALGSQYNFNKIFFHFNGYYTLFPGTKNRTVFAGSVGYGNTMGAAPFFEYADEWSSEGDIDGMGGSRTLRGYKMGRFVAPVMQYANFELRYRFLQTSLLNQHLAFQVVPFFDEGGVWNNMSRMTHLGNLRYSKGLGMRIVWNANTVLRFDYATSQEDKQFFFNLGHTF